MGGFRSSRLAESNGDGPKSQFFLVSKSLIWSFINPRKQSWRNLVHSIKRQLIILVSFRIKWGIRIHEQNVIKMPKTWNTIMNFSLYSSCSFYQFLAWWWMILIGIRSVDLEEAIGMKIRSWIHLQISFQYWPFLRICSSLWRAFLRSLVSILIRVVF